MGIEQNTGYGKMVPGSALHPQSFSPDDYVITAIRRAIHNGQSIRLAVSGYGAAVIQGGTGVFCTEPGGFDPVYFCKAPAEDIQVEVLRPEQAEKSVHMRRSRTISDLLWMAGFHASEGRLMEECNLFDVVHVKHWPNLTRLPYGPNTMRIMALLTRFPTSIGLARRVLKVDLAEACQFYSAARCAGITRVVNSPASEPVLKPHKSHKTLADLLAKIAGL